jgi:hypothetical protein
MIPEDFHDMIEGKEGFQPFVIKTRSGRVYPITDRSNIWIPGLYGNVACVALKGQGITLLDISAIEAVQFEVDVAASGRG